MPRPDLVRIRARLPNQVDDNTWCKIQSKGCLLSQRPPRYQESGLPKVFAAKSGEDHIGTVMEKWVSSISHPETKFRGKAAKVVGDRPILAKRRPMKSELIPSSHKATKDNTFEKLRTKRKNTQRV